MMRPALYLAGVFVAKATSSHFQSLVTKSCRAMAEIDSQIPPDLLAPPPPPAPLHSKNGLFLTGASGFLGVHVLSHVLQPTTSAPVFCFLRGGCKDDALSRRQHSAAAANVELSWHRVTVIVGDISLPLFGLNADEFSALALNIIEVIIHNGAAVHWLQDHSCLRQTNVIATHTCARSAHAAAAAAFVHVSSSSSITPAERKAGGSAGSLLPPPAITDTMSGYAATKRVMRCEA